jgi:predicted nucleotide-binding protein (sugar kinase/HSP70/actin superfamily)
MRDMKTQDQTAQAATGSNALVVAGYFETLRNEIKEYEDEKYWAPIRAAEKRRAEERVQMLASMTEEDRVKFLENEAKEKAKAEKKAAAKPYKAPRHRNPKRGSGTRVGYEAGERVSLRREID